jgi:hypothetical protein
MPITTVQYKAAIEAKIAAATGSTSSKDLTLIKTNADLWLLNNPSGSITGYASLEALIQTKQGALAVGTSNTELSLVGAAAFPQKEPALITGFKNKFQALTSSNWTVPANVYTVMLLLTAGGEAGQGTGVGTGTSVGLQGGMAAPTIWVALNVFPGDVLQLIVGAGGTGNAGSSGNLGGATEVYLNGRFVGKSICSPNPVGFGIHVIGLTRTQIGASGNSINNPGVAGNTCLIGDCGLTGTNGGVYQSGSLSYSVAGVAASSFAGNGGGGSSSFYGPGGPGGRATSLATSPTNGTNAPPTSYGAGGGGSSGQNGGSTASKGGDGTNGIVEIYY